MNHPPCKCGYNGQISTCMCIEAVTRRAENLAAGRRVHEGFMAHIMSLGDPRIPDAVREAVREHRRG